MNRIKEQRLEKKIMNLFVLFLSVFTLAMNVVGLFGAKLMFSSHSFLFPATLPFLTSLVVFVALAVYQQFLLKRSHGHERDPEFWMYMFFFGVAVGLSTGFSALSIAAQDISMKEIIEASQPIFTLCTFVFYEKQKVTTIQLVGIFMTVFGVLCSVFETPNLAINGAIYSLIIVVSNAFVSSLSTQIKILYPFINNFLLMMYSSTFMLMTTLFISLSEASTFGEYVQLHAWDTIKFVLLSGLTMIVYQYVNLKLIECTSSLFASMVYSLKIILVILLSVLFFEHSDPNHPKPNAAKWIGMAITASGFMVYAFTFLAKKGVHPV